ncbi:MAG: quinolinate synthase NadA [Flavobacteriales bacterium]|nr:quinolinate synthase NadA [Flavobacteriales bacterium]
MEANTLKKEIIALKKEKQVIVLAHYYQTAEIKEIADYIGDSLFLAQQAKKLKCDKIVMAGVYFMAEMVKILNPTAKVMIPDPLAGCSLADSICAEDLRKFRSKNPDFKIISYINCSAEVKAESDIICTSSNAVKIAKLFSPNEKILFVPDANLGQYVNNVAEMDMWLWNGTCIVHDAFSMEKLMKILSDFPGTPLIAHPEAPPYILRISSFIGSTSALLDYIKTAEESSFIIATEAGILDEMRRACPNKTFIPAPIRENNTCACSECAYMKLITLPKILNCLQNETHQVDVPDELIRKARIPLNLMLQHS